MTKRTTSKAKIKQHVLLVAEAFLVVGLLIGRVIATTGDEDCTIAIGGGGETLTFRRNVSAGSPVRINGFGRWDFIRSTRGPCHFTVHNWSNWNGRNVVLGSNLSLRIRGGEDGITKKDGGGGDTWRIRSITITRMDTSCRLNIGGNGVRMDYYAGRTNKTPELERISGFYGGDCSAKVWNDSEYGSNSSWNRFKSLHPSGTIPTYNPSFRIRSMIIQNNQGTCDSVARDRGRCLPSTTLPYSIFSYSPSSDQDRDGLDDYAENMLAEQFKPIYINHSTEDATRTNVYTAADNTEVMEPVTIFQVARTSDTTISIQYMKLWLWDRYNSLWCGGHKGDSQPNWVYLKTYPTGHSKHGKYWWVYSTSGGTKSELAWSQGDQSVRGVHFEALPGQTERNHIVIYFTKGKHHEYADAGWSGQSDRECGWPIKAWIDSRGHLHNPAYPRRAAVLRSPSGNGDRYDYNNVGSSSHRFFNSLSSFGFSGECIWTCGNFYEVDSASRNFI